MWNNHTVRDYHGRPSFCWKSIKVTNKGSPYNGVEGVGNSVVLKAGDTKGEAGNGDLGSYPASLYILDSGKESARKRIANGAERRLDISKAAFKKLNGGSLDPGVLNVEW